MTVHTIPLLAEPQSFNITLANVEYKLTVRWFEAPEGGWVMDIAEPENAEPIVCGIPLVAGCDLLSPYYYFGFGGEIWVNGWLPPTLEDLGTAEKELVFVVREDGDE